MKWHSIVVFVYALLVLVGGMMGYLKAHSNMSLVMGSITGILLLIASFAIYKSYGWGLFLAFGVTALLMFFFGVRFYLTQALFPAGFMTLVSIISMIFLSFLPKK